ncbi:recombinase family protein [Enterobacter hormaechei]|uniref:recombinase family protein n=1 Tax=Enterobacter hormaechei TaxID=158836 RepID=UPI003F41F68B
MRKFIYARVSTSDKGQDIQTQIHSICEAHSDVMMTFIDEGVSGTVSPSKRVGFARMMSILKPGDVVVITAYDRLSRNTIDFLNLLDELKAKGVSLVSMRERIDTSTSQGYFMATQFMAMAKYERDLISERTKLKLNKLKAEGKVLGRHSTGDTAKAAEMITEGCSVAGIVSVTGVSRATVYRMKKAA